MKKSWTRIAGVMAVSLIMGCQASGPAHQKEAIMAPPDGPQTGGPGGSVLGSPFYNTLETPDSPRPPNPQWRGVMISAAERNILSLRSPMVLLRGMYRIQGSQYPAKDRLKLTAVDIRTRQEYTGFAGQKDASPDAPPPEGLDEPPDPATMARMVFSGFFNTDLRGVLGLPATPGSYRVWAEYGPIKSNEITLQIVDK
jgi:hypothetical protein